MPGVRDALRIGLVLGLSTIAAACGQQANGQAVGAPDEVVDEGPPPPAGSTCSGRCPTGQICVESICRYRASSAAGEVMAAGGAAQLAVGDAEGALGSYEQSLEYFETAGAPIPPSVLCGAAKAALRVATNAERREAGARRADACFRGSLVGDPLRREVEAMLSRLRFDGLQLLAFDLEEPSESFFTAEPSRPTLDAVQIALSIGESDERGFEELSERLRGEAATHGIATCFVAEWERSHEREGQASLLLRFQTRLRDMGDYDLYAPEVEVIAGAGDGDDEADAFTTCLAEALAPILTEEMASFRRPSSQWEEPFDITASVH